MDVGHRPGLHLEPAVPCRDQRMFIGLNRKLQRVFSELARTRRIAHTTAPQTHAGGAFLGNHLVLVLGCGSTTITTTTTYAGPVSIKRVG
jgi:hypothetical protein